MFGNGLGDEHEQVREHKHEARQIPQCDPDPDPDPAMWKRVPSRGRSGLDGDYSIQPATTWTALQRQVSVDHVTTY